MILPDLVIAPSAKGGKGGLGVFTTRAFDEGTIVEISPVLPLTKAERMVVEATKLYYYIFEWGPEEGAAAIGLGYISMYNHSFDSNCEYEMDFEEGTMSVKTVKPIAVGEELFINYNGDAEDKSSVWFDVI